jgi:hypothetical protein
MDMHERNIRECIQRLICIFTTYERVWEAEPDSKVYKHLRNVRMKLGYAIVDSPTQTVLGQIGQFFLTNLNLMISSPRFIRMPNGAVDNTVIADRYRVVHMYENIIESYKVLRLQLTEPLPIQNVIDAAFMCMEEAEIDVKVDILGDMLD